MGRQSIRPAGVTRREFGSALLGAGLAASPIRVAAQAPRWRARQFHNQPAESHQHQFLVELWNAVRRETAGRMEVTVLPQNDDIPGSDPAALEMLRAGDLEFFTLMGGILGRAVPVAEIQGLPFAFRTH